jgi:coenzyme F420-reducing hydrogenase alpha subunit
VTHRTPASRTLRVDALTRVEGEGAMHVEIVDGRVHDVQLRIYEPPRFFEAFLRGRAHTEPPDITARICGICPVAYQMSACLAVEDACGVRVDGPIAELRRLLFCGEWIESHTLHIAFLHAPDFLGCASAIELAERDRPALERALRVKKAGNDLIELVGGRAIHPVNPKVGGFHRAPRRDELEAFADRLRAARDDAVAMAAWVAGFPFPDFEVDHEFVALRQDDGRYPILGGRLVSDRGLDLAPSGFEAAVAEEQVAHSTALHARLLERGNYLVGPLARYSLNFERLTPLARRVAVDAGLGPTCRNPFRSIVVRAVEVVHACDEALALIDAYERPDPPAVEVPPRAGTGCGWTEAPRGMLWHRYDLEADGTIAAARIVPPTSQNQPTIEHDLFHLVEHHIHDDDETLRTLAEQAIRNYDPCISCATHFLDLTVERRRGEDGPPACAGS